MWKGWRPRSGSAGSPKVTLDFGAQHREVLRVQLYNQPG
jgi:hypothetical protein